MDPLKMRVLIVEDNEEWSNRIARVVESIFKQYSYPFNTNDSIKRAKDREEAEKLISSKDKFNLVTMDMDLTSGKDADGLKLLGMLRQYQPNAVSVVISARGHESSIVRPSFSQHRVFQVVDKADDTPAVFRSALTAAIQYADVIEMAEDSQFEQAEKKLIQLEKLFPDIGIFKDMRDEIKQLYRYQITGLPGQDAVHSHMDFMRKSQKPWEVCSLSINHFTKFHEIYSSFSSANVLKQLAFIIKQAIENIELVSTDEQDGLFAGYIGEHEFILTTFTEQGDYISTLEKLVSKDFAARVKVFYNAMDVDGPSPRFRSDELMTLQFKRKKLQPGEYAGIGLDDFLKEVWSEDDNKPVMDW